MSNNKNSALFVCLGNICRSPIAEAVFIDTVAKAGEKDKWLIDSAGIGDWHSGSEPDHRARQVMKSHSLAYTNKARQIRKDDFNTFGYIFGMDDDNISDLKARAPKNSSAKILLLGDFDPEGDRIIRDPYYDRNSAGFEKCYDQCVRSCRAFLEKVHNKEPMEMTPEPECKCNLERLKVLFVCIGNSCRSPMAESVLKHMITNVQSPKLQWVIDSAALADWNVGLQPEPRCIRVLNENGLSSEHIARQITENDFFMFDYIFGMDKHNINELEKLAPKFPNAKIELLATYDFENSNVIHDPYFENGIEGFRTAYCKIFRSCENFIQIQLKRMEPVI